MLRKVKQLKCHYRDDSGDFMVFNLAQSLHANLLSLFKYNETDNNFVLVGRHSENVSYTRKKKLSYSACHGCLGRAWEKGTCFVYGLPNPETDLSNYEEHCKTEWSIPKLVSKDLSMKSRTYFGMAIKNNNKPSERIGVLILESLNDQFPGNLLEEVIAKKIIKSNVYAIFPWIIEKSPLPK